MANNMYYSILTTVGTEKLAQAIITEIPVKITTIAVGDGNGQFYSPTPDQTQLKRETWRGGINDLRGVEDAANHVLAEGVVPDVGGWTVREVGLFDDIGDLIAICNHPDTIKPLPTSGSGKQLYIQIHLIVDNVAALELVIDGSIVLASKAYVDLIRTDLASGPGAGMIKNVYNHYASTEDIKNLDISPLTLAIYTNKYSIDSITTGRTELLRDSDEDDIHKASTDWLINGVINGKALIYDKKGHAFRLAHTNGYISIESLGGGKGEDDSAIMEMAQLVSSKPVQVIPGKTYYYSRPVKHISGRGWIGNNTVFLCAATPNKTPFISSLLTPQGMPNDTVHGTTGVRNVRVEGIIIDTNYLDSTGGTGFNFSENTLDDWVDCQFLNVTFKNAKFKCLALQNKCNNILIEACEFRNSGQDNLIIRKGCENISLIRSHFSDSAMISSLGGGDGVVVKARFTLVDGCFFKNIGNAYKGAAIACNAEDADTVDQVSDNTFINNQFIGCYGGLGIGTVNSDFIAAGQLIRGFTLDNNIFIGTIAIAIGIRYVKDVNAGRSKIISQSKSNYFASELINVINVNGDFDVRTAQGGALSVSNSTGRVSVIANDVSKAAVVNAVVINSCDGLTVDANINKAGRAGIIITSFYNGDISLQVHDIAQLGVSLYDVKRTPIKSTISYCGYNGLVLSSIFNCDVVCSIFDAGYHENAIYSALRYISGDRNRIKVISDSGQLNRPAYDLLVESGTAGTAIYYISSAGVVGQVSQISGSTATLIDELATVQGAGK